MSTKTQGITEYEIMSAEKHYQEETAITGIENIKYYN